jgi:MFS family permease
MSDPSTDAGAILRDRNFLLFILSRTGNGMGIHILTVAVAWHVYELTKDPLDLGYIGLAQFAPHFALFLVAGMAADRLDRRGILAVCNLVHLVVVALLTMVLWRDLGGVPMVLAILVVHGIARAFFHTASQAILPNLVSTALFPKAVAYSSSANKVAQLAGPALGGLLVAYAGDWAYYTAAAMFALAGVGSVMIRGALHVRSAEPMGLATLLGGFNYVWSNKVVLGAVSIDLFAVLLGGVMGLLPIYAADILNVGAEGLGVMRAMPGVGSLMMGLALTRIAAPSRMGPALFISLAVFGASIVVFSLSEIFWLSLVALWIYGASDMVSVYIRLTLVQIATPDAMRGRVSAVNSVSINASNELGDFRAGLTAAFIGTVPAVLVGGVATLAVTALWAKLFPAMRRIDRLDDLNKG